ncbi:hypothetical protein [Yeosuana marina]|uniref:hypothetical protein n=1 Tax=Yeosuana marina TaxID=1565536 RepID=UPI00142175B3|nr:hypothetical protein [Yeosuana marina]
MKQALNILIAYLTCTDPIIQNKWLNLLSSFWHKDSGWLLKSITAQSGGYKFTIVDSDGNEVDHIISVPALPNSQPISYIQDLQTTLDNKVDKAAGKGLSTNDFTTALKTKLDGLVNYVHPEFHQISEIEDLQTLLDTFAVYDDLALVAKTNDYNDLQNKPLFKVVENEYADMAALYADQGNQTDAFIQFVTDASAHPNVDSGSAYFEYLGSVIGDENDYRLLTGTESSALSTSITQTKQITNNGEDGSSRYIQESEISQISLQAPFLEELIPDTYLPSTTGNFILKGAYFIPAMCNGEIPNAIQISGGDNVINYCTFINDNEICVNLTTSATDGLYDVTLNNGVSSTFVGVLQVINGTVYEPTNDDWTFLTGGHPDVSEVGAVSLTNFGTLQTVKWNKALDYTKDFKVLFRYKRSVLGIQSADTRTNLLKLGSASDSSWYQTEFQFQQAGASWNNMVYLDTSDQGLKSKSLGIVPSGTPIVDRIPAFEDAIFEFRYLSGVMYYYVNDILVHQSTRVITEDMYLYVTVQEQDFESIKYIDLSDTGGALADRRTKLSTLNIDSIDLSSIPEYADDTAAASGGLDVGQGYINSSTGALQKRLA